VETLRDGQSIVLDSGTTVIELARKISEKKIRLTVVTNDLLVASILSTSPNIKLIVPGGELRPGSYTLLGEPGLSFISNLHVDAAYIGIQAITENHLCDTSTEVCKMKRYMVAASSQTILLSDSSKFGKTAFFNACDITDIDLIITDPNLSEQLAEYYREKGVKIVFA
jgi:DeoR/GlpR family transcriptional regulator of sugar metabolism